MSKGHRPPAPNKEDKKLLKLRNEWYAKLKKAGFDDIEYAPKNSLTYPGSIRPGQPNNLYVDLAFKWRDSEQYYRAAGHFLYDYQFDSIKDRRVWELHSQGLSLRKIESELGFSFYVVQKIVKRLKTEMLAQLKENQSRYS